MVLNGITWHDKHSQLDFGATLIEREINPPEKERVTDRAPYSSVTYDFTSLYGSASYSERPLRYVFVISDIHGIDHLKPRVNKFRHWLYDPIEKSELYDDSETDYHYNAVCTGFLEKYSCGGIKAEITVTFQADPFTIPNFQKYSLDFPDLDEDGSITASDSSLILAAAANVGAGQESGLTEKQERLADIDLDGRITAIDASILLEFAAKCGAGQYSNSPEGWKKYIEKKSEVT